MDVVFLAGPMASGKSTVAEELRDLGAWRIDLDAVSRSVTGPGEPCLGELVRAFGADIVREDGTLDRAALAERAFASAEAAERLEAIELPYIKRALVEGISYAATVAEHDACLVVEVPLLDRVEDLLGLADEVLVVSCAPERRRELAAGRGVSAEDFGRRGARQPDEAYLAAHATATLVNDGDIEALRERAREWYAARGYPVEGASDG